jgi:hypothetical protein
MSGKRLGTTFATALTRLRGLASVYQVIEVQY